ncbi:MAG: TadE/TadG family type IV pilus assembly protein [Novosphingobium sp.]
MLHRLKKLRSAADGSVIVEFALLAPLLIGMFMGVLQIGIGMQNYNALRGISGDVARYAVVNYQTSNRLTTSQLQDYTNGIAGQAPYGLTRSRFTVTINTATTQRVAGAVEYTMTLRYNVPTMLSLLGVDEIPITYARPIFVIAP